MHHHSNALHPVRRAYIIRIFLVFFCLFKVCIARDNRRGIELYTKSGKLYHERAATRDLLRYIKTKAKSREEQLQKMKEVKKSEYGTQRLRGGGQGKMEGSGYNAVRIFSVRLVRQNVVQEAGRGGEVTSRPCRVSGQLPRPMLSGVLGCT